MTKLESNIPRSSASNSALFRAKRRFIAKFDFTNPNWSSLPAGFPNLSKEGLTKQEGYLLDAIKTAWIVEDDGRTYLYKTYAKRALVAVAVVFILFAGRNLVINRGEYTNTASAKTVTQTVGNIVESTRSAILRR